MSVRLKSQVTFSGNSPAYFVANYDYLLGSLEPRAILSIGCRSFYSLILSALWAFQDVCHDICFANRCPRFICIHIERGLLYHDGHTPCTITLPGEKFCSWPMCKRAVFCKSQAEIFLSCQARSLCKCLYSPGFCSRDTLISVSSKRETSKS